MRCLIVGCFLLGALCGGVAAEWKPAAPRLLTRWAKDVDPANTLPEYPRPQFQRDNWQSLNGLWDYAITDRKAGVPQKWDGQVLVPFAVESSLSGVGKTVGPEQALWYRRKFTLDQNEKTQHHRTLLHFGAVDWSCQVYLNGQPIEYARHTGGYDPFSFYIDHPSSKLNLQGENELIVRVLDNTDEGYQPRGKQVQKPNGIWYTPVSGIWQTVWIEREPLAAVQGLKITPDVDKSSVRVEVKAGLETKAPVKSKIKVEVLDGEQVFATAEGVTDRGTVTLDIPLKEPKLWSPEQPHLYGLRVSRVVDVIEGRKVGEFASDTITSYFGIRKIAMQKDDKGVNRLFLNNKPVFQFGPLDQGWWPDGLYTAPTDEALKFDIEMTKRLGYNMARKHVKVEPDRWYYWCDKLGLLVWQDMPSGDVNAPWDPVGGHDNTELTRSPESMDNYNKEWKAIIDALHNHPSIVMWVPFNEAWGQANTVAVTKWTMEYDPSRLVNCASGGNDFPVGHVLDVHRYPGPFL
ncbi:MAG: beta-galactosidase, partial [Planctomycetota bacterium]